MNAKKLITYGVLLAVVLPKIKERLQTKELRKSYQESHRLHRNQSSILDKLPQ
ncbi:hypothetical protein [Bacillus sp. REN10]|uniref:hypothetical protein n=1 Tax=Bacillus sp. REN10 TaxID=2782541 RepID=UPI00193AE8A2|nr:hypothetical protein [Bacillus sp. REN10]